MSTTKHSGLKAGILASLLLAPASAALALIAPEHQGMEASQSNLDVLLNRYPELVIRPSQMPSKKIKAHFNKLNIQVDAKTEKFD